MRVIRPRGVLTADDAKISRSEQSYDHDECMLFAFLTWTSDVVRIIPGGI
jgi:hypothetical protein